MGHNGCAAEAPPADSVCWPDRAYALELLRPWKLVTFVIAMALLLYGAVNFHIADWDVGVTLIMGSLTYGLAPWSTALLITAVRRRPRRWMFYILVAAVVTLFVVDGSYWIYHTLAGNTMYRRENFILSLATYLAAGILWAYRGSFWALVRDTLAWLKPTW